VRALAETDARVDLLVDCLDVAHRIAASDLVVGAAGSTVWEMCCLGVPSAITAVAENQSDIAKAVAGAGASIDLGPLEILTPNRVADAIRPLLRDPLALRRMSERAAAICDGKGASRIAAAIGAVSGLHEGHRLVGPQR
jgi:spore coat polysaccharide biosynthesis predicted glycosyltransferase SpsG